MYIYTCSPLSVWLSQSMSPKAKWCLISAMKVRWNVTGFSPWKSGTLPKCLRKYHTRSKAKPQSPESQCQNHVFTSNLQKLRFYQNKGLSLDMRCGVPNTFPTYNQTSELKNQDFLPSTLDKEKCPFFNIGLVIKSTRSKWPITS